MNVVQKFLERRSLTCYIDFVNDVHRRQKMFKTLITLVRGRAVAIGEEVADQNALLILDQQMRDASGALDRARRALAVAIAQDNQEGQRLDATRARIEDLETRAVAALDAGHEDLAGEAAEAIATLEAERDASATARTLFAAEITKLKGHVLQQQMRFGQLDRGRRIARATEAVRVARRGRIEGAPIFEGTLTEAEATLSHLRERQAEADAAEAAFDALDAATGPIAVAEKLSAEGFGARLKPNAVDVLARLRERAAGSQPSSGA
jgi:phage shock protein A